MFVRELVRRFAGHRRLARRVLPQLVVFCWPFACLWFYSLRFGDRYLAIGNDFGILYDYKLYLLDHLVRWRVPLWSPSESAGFPFFASPFAQVLYPLNTLLAGYYWLTGGYTPLDHQRFATVGVSIFALGLFKWLRSLGLPLRPALFATLVMASSFKITEILRFPHAVHTAAWYPWILFAVTNVLRTSHARQRRIYGALLWFSCVAFLTGGYFYYVFYSPLLFGPYLLLFVVPPLRRRILGITTVAWRAVVPVVAAAALAAAAVCGPYLLAVRSLLQQTADRAGNSFEYSTVSLFSFEDTLGSLVFPPAAQAEGWYYFGVVAVLMILLFLFSRSGNPYRDRPVDTDGTGVADAAGYSAAWSKAYFGLWVAGITYLTYGRNSWLFVQLWHRVPMFASLRVWGRLNIVLVPVIGWLLAIAYQHVEREISEPSRGRGRAARLGPLVVLTTSGAMIVFIQIVLQRARLYDPYWIDWFVNGSLPQLRASSWFAGIPIGPDQLSEAFASTFIISALCGLMVLLLLVGLSRRRPFRSDRALTTVMVALTLVAVLDVGIVGPFMWTAGFRTVQPRRMLNAQTLNEQSFSVPRVDGVYRFLSLSPAFHVNTVATWYFERYATFRRRAGAEPAAVRRLLGVTDGQRLFCSATIAHDSVQSLLDDADQFAGCDVKMTAYTGDTLGIAVDSPGQAYVSFIDNWAEGWEAEVDGTPAPIDRLFGTFKAVAIPAGRHRVLFAYRPRLFEF